MKQEKSKISVLMSVYKKENPEYLRNMVKKCNAKSTDLQSLEEVDHLCDKCTLYAHNWDDVADKLWEENKKDK